MQKLKKSRRQLYEEVERNALKPLPSRKYEFSKWSRPRVNIDYHVEVEGHLYSVPYSLARAQVDARATESTVELFFQGRRVASHTRKYQYGHTTCAEHMPSSHRAHAEWTPSRVLKWAAQVGPSTGALAEELMRRKPHPEMGFRACLGVIRLTKKYESERVEKACARALRLGAVSYKSVVAILRNNLDRVDAELPKQASLPLHENVRGPRYYH